MPLSVAAHCGTVTLSVPAPMVPVHGSHSAPPERTPFQRRSLPAAAQSQSRRVTHPEITLARERARSQIADGQPGRHPLLRPTRRRAWMRPCLCPVPSRSPWITMGWVDGWMDGWTDGRTDGRTDRQTDSQQHTLHHHETKERSPARQVACANNRTTSLTQTRLALASPTDQGKTRGAQAESA